MWHFKPEIKCDMPLVITTKVKSLDKEEWEEVMDLGIDIFWYRKVFGNGKMIFVKCKPDVELVKIFGLSRRELFHIGPKQKFVND